MILCRSIVIHPVDGGRGLPLSTVQLDIGAY